MKRKGVLVFPVIFMLFLLSILSSGLNVEKVKASGTIYIRADGSIEPLTAPIQRVGYVYTLTDNVSESIVVERSNIVVDGDGYTIQGSGAGYGFELSNIDNVVVKNSTIRGFDYGIWMESSSNITLFDNIINENEFSIRVSGSELAHYKHSISDSNLVDGKPIYYLTNQKDLIINHSTHPEVAFLALINCTNISVEDLTLSKSGQGLLFQHTNNSRIINNNVTNNSYGIWLEESSNITVSGNNITDNNNGAHLSWASFCNISRNKIEVNKDSGIKSSHSTNNTISLNNITGNDDGIHLESSSINIISENNITDNSRFAVLLSGSSDNRISENKLGKIKLKDYSDRNIVTANNIESNTGITCSHNNTVSLNKIRNGGLILDGASANNDILRNQITNLKGFAVTIDGTYRMAPYNTVSHNNITNSNGGIYLISRYDIISENNITNNGRTGIDIRYALYNVVSGNNIRNHRFGITLYGHNSLENEISGNNITECLNTCISVVSDTGSNLISNNYLANSTTALYLQSSDENNITLNTIVNNRDSIKLFRSNYDIISGNIIANNSDNGIVSSSCKCNTISDNNITNNDNNGIELISSPNNTISRNVITNSYNGIWLEASSNNTFFRNTIADNLDGIGIHTSSNNTFYFNNFINNTRQVYIQTPDCTNFWNISYPSGGNYWSNYLDLYPNATEIDGSGIWDTPYAIDEDNIDHYPLIPEFPSLIILPLFMMLSLSVAHIRRRRNLSKSTG